MTTTEEIAQTLADKGLVGVFAILAKSDGEPAKDGVPLTMLAWYDPATMMFFDKTSGEPIGPDPKNSARTVLPYVIAHDALAGTPFGQQDDPRLLDLATDTSEVWGEARRWHPDEHAKAPEYVNAYCHPWCAIVAEEKPRYKHVYGLVIYWETEAPTVMVHSWLYDTHQKVPVECNPAVPGGDATYVGMFAPKDLLSPELRGRTGLSALRLFYAGLPR